MKPIALLAYTCILLCTLWACDPGTTSTPAPTTTANGQVTEPASPPSTTDTPATREEPSLAELEKKGQTMSTTAFNNEVATARESGERWTGSPLTVALRFAGEGFDCRKKSVEVESLSGGEVFNKVMVCITEDGYLDDSLRGSKVILRMEESNGFWTVTSAKKVWCCWENRGHTEYNSQPCH